MKDKIAALFSSITRKEITVSLVSLGVGFLVGLWTLSLIIPGATGLVRQFKEEEETLRQMKEGRIAPPEDILIAHSSALRSESEKEFLSDMLKYNGIVYLSASRVLAHSFDASDETQALAERMIRTRDQERQAIVRVLSSLDDKKDGEAGPKEDLKF